MILLIDNYDSFTYNLYQYLLELGQQVKVIRNDAIDVAGIRKDMPKCIVISPGPGRPEDAGICPDIIKELDGELPILGICLGHQVIGQVYGMKIVGAPTLVHGKSSKITHDGKGVYEGLEQELEVGRYHSLAVQDKNLPDYAEVTSRTKDGVIMGLRHKANLTEGIQFHPESILTPSGKSMLANFLKLVKARSA